MKRTVILSITLLTLIGFGWTIGSSVPPATAQFASQQVSAAQTQVFAIENMNCALCPITVKKAMEGVAGVTSVAVDFDAKTATVVFDRSVTNADAIAAASTNAGYPASVKG